MKLGCIQNFISSVHSLMTRTRYNCYPWSVLSRVNQPFTWSTCNIRFLFSIRILIIYLVESERIWIATKRGERAIARVLQLGLGNGQAVMRSCSLFLRGQGAQSPSRSLGGLATALLQLAASYLEAMDASFALQTWRYRPTELGGFHRTVDWCFYILFINFYFITFWIFYWSNLKNVVYLFSKMR